ncbi:MAG: ATP-binding protein [Burkholderiaceae bacterium]
MRSIRRSLLVGIIGAVTISIVLTASLVFQSARRSTDALLDDHLRQIALTVPAPRAPMDLLVPFEDPISEGIMIQIWDRNGVHVYRSSTEWELPERAALGFSTVSTRQGPLRVYSALRAGTLVQAAQPLQLRTRIAARSAIRQTAPLALLSAALALLVWVLVGRGLAPLREVREALARRAPDSLQPLGAEGMPTELQPLVNGINALLGRLDDAFRNQRAFLADAAHELRTPLAAVRLQLDLLRRAETASEREIAGERLAQGIGRLGVLVDQLLLLARQDADAEVTLERVDIDPVELIGRCAADHAALAEMREIDLGVADDSASLGELQLHGDPQSLTILMANLVGNSLRYVPAGGRVDLWCGLEGGELVLRVDDDGPGIAPAERERVFDRFYRTDHASTGPHGEHGSGLGLSIVQQVARRHGAKVCLLDNPRGRGLRVEVRFPAP